MARVLYHLCRLLYPTNAKQREINDIKDAWRLWSQDEIEDRLQGYDRRGFHSLTSDESHDAMRIRTRLIELKETQLEKATQDGTLTLEERI